MLYCKIERGKRLIRSVFQRNSLCDLNWMVRYDFSGDCMFAKKIHWNFKHLNLRAYRFKWPSICSSSSFFRPVLHFCSGIFLLVIIWQKKTHTKKNNFTWTNYFDLIRKRMYFTRSDINTNWSILYANRIV